MAVKTKYKCSSCGAILSKWAGKCPKCGEWNTIEEEKIDNNKKINPTSKVINPVTLKDVKTHANDRIVTGINEFDRVVGGGLVDDSITIFVGSPGIGKSTTVLSICDKMISLGKTVVYASGEESASQIKSRAQRMDLKNIGDVYISDTTCLDDVLALIDTVDADFVVADSIQTFALNEFLPSRAGNPTQVMECASALQDCAKRSKKPRAIIIIGQMTKDDELAGSRALEHLVDTVLMLEGDSNDTFRILYATKNRFGDTGETGFFQMTEHGMDEVTNPSEFFLTARSEPVVGTSLTVLKEGSRPLIVEIESLVTQSSTSYPARITETMSRDRLNVLISILEQHCNMLFMNKNVIINAQNNIKLRTSDTSLATLMSICSSYFQTPLPYNSVFLADVGLTGELKKIPNIDVRLKELDRMGYDKVYVASNVQINKDFKNIKIVRCNMISDVLKDVGYELNLVKRYEKFERR